MEAEIQTKVEKLSDTVYGNGRIGLVRQVDKIEIEISSLKESVKKVVESIEDAKKFLLITIITVNGKMLYELLKWLISLGRP